MTVKGTAAVHRFLAGSGLPDIVEKSRKPDMDVFHSCWAGIAHQKAMIEYIKVMIASLPDATAFHQFRNKEIQQPRAFHKPVSGV